MSIAPQPHQINLYEADYVQWLEQTIRQLKSCDFTQVDWPHLIEEIEDRGRSERRSLKSNLVIVLLHLLKWNYQSEYRSRRWQASILEHRRRIREALTDSLSLKPFLEKVLAECYADAVEQAAIATGLPSEAFLTSCPYLTEQILDSSYLPE